MNTLKHTTIAVVCSPGRAIFADDLLDLTVKAYEAGINLTGEWIRKATFCPSSGGVILQGGCEDKHYNANGTIEN